MSLHYVHTIIFNRPLLNIDPLKGGSGLILEATGQVGKGFISSLSSLYLIFYLCSAS